MLTFFRVYVFLDHHHQRGYIYSKCQYFFYRYLSYIFSGFLFRKTKRTHKKWQTALHETIHSHPNLLRKRTRGDKEVLLNGECLEENMSVSSHLEQRETKQTEKGVKVFKVCSQSPVCRNHWQKAEFKVTIFHICLKIFSSLLFFSHFLPLSGNLTALRWKSTKIGKKVF